MSTIIKEDDKVKLIDRIDTNFNTDVIKDILKSRFTNAKTKITDETIDLICEIAKAMTIEAAIRAARHAQVDNIAKVTLDQVEAILPQMLLDFP